MFEPLLRFTNTNCTGQTHKQTNTLFLLEKPPFAHVKGTTKKADAFGLFVYPNFQNIETAHLNSELDFRGATAVSV